MSTINKIIELRDYELAEECFKAILSCTNNPHDRITQKIVTIYCMYWTIVRLFLFIGLPVINTKERSRILIHIQAWTASRSIRWNSSAFRSGGISTALFFGGLRGPGKSGQPLKSSAWFKKNWTLAVPKGKTNAGKPLQSLGQAHEMVYTGKNFAMP